MKKLDKLITLLTNALNNEDVVINKKSLLNELIEIKAKLKYFRHFDPRTDLKSTQLFLKKEFDVEPTPIQLTSLGRIVNYDLQKIFCKKCGLDHVHYSCPRCGTKQE